MTTREDRLAAREVALARREKTVEQRSNREHEREQLTDQRVDVVQGREQTADRRDNAVQEREHHGNQRDHDARVRSRNMRLREIRVNTQQDRLDESNLMLRVLESRIEILRAANEKLLIATLKTQTLSDEIEKAREQLSNMAHHDFLTSLPNRSLLEERMTQAIALAKRHEKKMAVLFIDLDRFKTINDSLGHAVGDALLRSVALRLLSSVRSTDTVSRQGGDEFIALLTEVTDETAVAEFADKMCKTISAPYQVEDQDLHIGVTLGISLYPDDGADAETLIRHADVAMYHTKRNGGNNYSFFKPEMNAMTVERQKIEADLFNALEQDQFELYYQTQVDLSNGRILGAEALIRWHHPTRGLLLPADFVAIAEGCGAIIPIGRWVLRQACRQVQMWLDAGLVLPGIAVNVSAHQFKANDFLQQLRSILHETQLDPQYLELELTESVLMKHADSTMLVLQELKKMGVKIAIDDFGTGYSSLSYLQRFSVDTLKIDQTFVAGITANDDVGVLIDSVINLGKSLGHLVIAEGVETLQQLDFLRQHGCDGGQGYYLNRAIPAHEFGALLKADADGNVAAGFLQLGLPSL